MFVNSLVVYRIFCIFDIRDPSLLLADAGRYIEGPSVLCSFQCVHTEATVHASMPPGERLGCRVVASSRVKSEPK